MTISLVLAAVVLLGGIGYAGLVLIGWLRFGRVAPLALAGSDPLLDTFIPDYDVVERHHIRIDAPPEIVLAAASDMDMTQSSIIRWIFAVRAFVLRATPMTRRQPHGLLDDMRALGWGDLASRPGREVVLGAITQPWLPNPTFRALPPASFQPFHEPGYVKIVWTLRAEPRADGGSDFWTETRAVATDTTARKRFRWYWARFSPGIALIRSLMLAPLKAAAERRSHLGDWSCSRPH